MSDTNTLEPVWGMSDRYFALLRARQSRQRDVEALEMEEENIILRRLVGTMAGRKGFELEKSVDGGITLKVITQ